MEDSEEKNTMSVSGGAHTMYTTIAEGAINSISTNKDSSQVVVAGRNVFKIYGIEEEEFVEKANLRVGKNLNLNFSAADVTWNPVEDHILASAATNGAVVTWNLNKASRSKQDLIFNEHKRTVNRVCFHSTECQWLLSGSQDGFMKLFDLRKQEVISTFSGKSESVRDVQFHPHHYFHFAAAFENGNVQIWDLRKPDKCERQFTAHSGPIFALDWHPEDKHWLATAGRDKAIKVWDLNINPRPKNIHHVQTIASVARIKWRPQRPFHIASSALLVDFNVNIWDIRRPYIPFAAFDEHKDVVTGIVWKHNEPHIFLSGGKDCRLYQHIFRDATRPAESANPVGVAINVHGDICHAASDKLIAPGGNKANYSTTKLPLFFRKAPDKSEQFTSVNSTLCVFDNEDEGMEAEAIQECAKRYQLSGRPLEELCEHNAGVAESIGKHQIAQTWRMIQLLYTTTTTTPSQSRTFSALTGAIDPHKASDTDRGRQLSGKQVSLDNSLHLDTKAAGNDNKEKPVADTTSGLSDSDSEGEGSDMERKLATIASGQANHHGDFFFGDGEMDQTDLDYDKFNHLESAQQPDWTLPSEAFQPRHVIVDQSDTPDPLQNQPDSPSSANESEFSSNLHTCVPETIKQEILTVSPFATNVPTWHFSSLVSDALHYYAEQGNVQTSVSILMVLGDKIKPHIDEVTQEQWLMSYIDLLARFKLWTIATEVIKMSNHPGVNQLNQQSTMINTSCHYCNKQTTRTGWLCDRCHQVTNTCSICHYPVKGLYVWCQGCAHGGHLQHIKEWLARNPRCPAGCGHFCEYT